MWSAIAPGGVLHVARDDLHMARLTDILRFVSPELTVIEFPAWDCLPYDRASPHRDILARRIDALTRVLLDLRAEAQKLPRDDPAFGLISGWSEADSVLDEDPQRYVQPYFSNSTEAARGFRDLGRVWQRLGRVKNNNIMEAWGDKLVAEGAALRADLDVALKRSTLDDAGRPAIPAIAGAREPFHAAVTRDRLDPQHRALGPDDTHLLAGGQVRPGNAPDRVAQRQPSESTLDRPFKHGFLADPLLGAAVEQRPVGLGRPVAGEADPDEDRDQG